MTPVRWGILSTARIATQKLIPALRKSAASEVVAIASRDLAKAIAAAELLGIPTAYGSYEALLADPAIEVIYNPLPNRRAPRPTLSESRPRTARTKPCWPIRTSRRSTTLCRTTCTCH